MTAIFTGAKRTLMRAPRLIALGGLLASLPAHLAAQTGYESYKPILPATRALNGSTYPLPPSGTRRTPPKETDYTLVIPQTTTPPTRFGRRLNPSVIRVADGQPLGDQPVRITAGTRLGGGSSRPSPEALSFDLRDLFENWVRSLERNSGR